MAIIVNRAPVLTLWTTMVAERLSRTHDTALTLGRSVAGSAEVARLVFGGHLRFVLD